MRFPGKIMPENTSPIASVLLPYSVAGHTALRTSSRITPRTVPRHVLYYREKQNQFVNHPLSTPNLRSLLSDIESQWHGLRRG